MIVKKQLLLIPSIAKLMVEWGMFFLGWKAFHFFFKCQYCCLNSLAHASLNQHADAVKCYERAVQLEPENESYQSNLLIAEEKLKQTPGGAERPLGPGMGIPGLDVGAMLNNPGMQVYPSIQLAILFKVSHLFL